LWYWGLNSGPSPWATPPALFLWRVFRDRVLQTICSGWLQTVILLISASWAAGITGMSHRHPAKKKNLFKILSGHQRSEKRRLPSFLTPISVLWKIQSPFIFLSWWVKKCWTQKDKSILLYPFWVKMPETIPQTCWGND
jgi:hypothetical protein